MGVSFSEETQTSQTPPGGWRGVLLLGAADLQEVLSPSVCLAALERMYAQLHASPADRGRSLGFETRDGKIHVKAGLYPHTHDFFAAKINLNFPDNPGRFDLPTIQGLIVLAECATGRPVSVLQSGVLTGLRTAAATALAAQHGARRDAARLAIIGCGDQAAYQATALCGVKTFTDLAVYDMDRSRTDAFAAWASDALALRVRVADTIADAVSTADVCVTSTTSTKPILSAAMAPKGCFIAAIGADNPDKQELDPDLLVDARIVVDDRNQCAASGDLAHALKAGSATIDDVDATLAELAAGAASARLTDDDIVIFDSTGVGVQDVAVAVAAYERATAAGVGAWADIL